MRGVLARRLGISLLVLLGASVLAFAVPQLTGVDPTQAVLRARIAEREPAPEVVAALERELGLERHGVIRYGLWLSDLATGDLGRSYVSRTPIGPSLVRATGITVTLVLAGLVGALALGLPLGVAAAARPRGWADRVTVAASQVGVSMPEYVLAPVLILVFAVVLGVLPSSGWQGPAHVVLPAVTLALSGAAFCAQLVRAEVTDALAHPAIRYARAKGLGERRLLWRHALRNALTSLIEILGLWFVGLLGGAVIVEVVFGIPGLGRLLYSAVIDSDIPVIQAGIVVAVALALVTSVVADLAQLLLDPVLRTGGQR